MNMTSFLQDKKLTIALKGEIDHHSAKDTMRIIVSGQKDQAMVTALFDNLGKGASGAAIQNMNILLGADETTGLNV